MDITGVTKQLLDYNFCLEDINEHGREILEQLWYEFSENNVEITVI